MSMEELERKVSFSPEEIRELRGSLSRANFADLLEVTPLTIYRWELPLDAAESRRPRRGILPRLRKLALEREYEKYAMFDSTDDYKPDPNSLEIEHINLNSATDIVSDIQTNAHERATLLPVLGDIAYANWDIAEKELIEILSSGRMPSCGQAIGQLALVQIQLLGRNDVMGAFSSLVPVLNQAASGELSPSTTLRTHVMAALLFSTPSKQLFDAGRVRAHVARAEGVVKRTQEQDLRILLRVGQLKAALHIGDQVVFKRRLRRYRKELEFAEQPIVKGLAQLVFAFSDYLDGHYTKAFEEFNRIANDAAKIGFTLVEIEALSFAALLALDLGKSPTLVLGFLNRTQDAIERSRFNPSNAEIRIASASAEAYLRLGKREEAQAELDRGFRLSDRVGWPPIDLLYGVTRVETNSDRLEEIVKQLEQCDGGAMRSAIKPALHFSKALVSFSKDDLDNTLEEFSMAADHGITSGTRPWLTSIALLYAYTSAVLQRNKNHARLALRRVERYFERMPAYWYEAVLRLSRGLYLAYFKRPDEAKQQLDAAKRAFQHAEDFIFSIYCDYVSSIAAYFNNDSLALGALQKHAQDLQNLKVRIPSKLKEENIIAIIDEILPSDAEALSDNHESVGPHPLSLPIARLTVRGVSLRSILEELKTIVFELTNLNVWIDEIDSSGICCELFRGKTTFSERYDDWPTFEFGDGCGRRFLLGIEGAISSATLGRIQTLIVVTGLSIEVASLRSGHKEISLAEEEELNIEIPGVIAASPQMNELVHDVTRLANSRATVLIKGESGTGKEVLARAIHERSPRQHKPYITFNCAATPRELFEGQLFGYRKGAFTGATANHPGVIRAANHGTLFLDEIGDLPLESQPKLLRFLENGEVFPLGETHAVRVDVRVLAATHRDLDEMIAKGRFREDLYYRLQVVTLDIAPLRERREDILALTRHFIRLLTPEEEKIPTLSQDAIRRLLIHPWPGNVREIRNVVERALAFSPLPSVLTSKELRFSNKRIKE